MRNVTVHDLIIVEREVEVPTHCPKCKEPVTELLCFEYQDQKRYAGIDDEGNIEWGQDLPEQGDSSMQVEWQCGQCGHTLAQANETRKSPPFPVDDVEMLIIPLSHPIELNEGWWFMHASNGQSLYARRRKRGS